jgi:hypothetical protein
VPFSSFYYIFTLYTGDNIEVAERIIKNSNLNASTEKLDNWVSSKRWLENTFSYIGILPEEVLRDGPFNLHGGLCFFQYKDLS